MFPSFAMSAVVRSAEMIVKGSLFRSAYELFFTPIPPHEKRTVKTAIDVGCDRVGDMLGAGVIQLILYFFADRLFTPLLLVTMTLAGLRSGSRRLWIKHICGYWNMVS